MPALCKANIELCWSCTAQRNAGEGSSCRLQKGIPGPQYRVDHRSLALRCSWATAGRWDRGEVVQLSRLQLPAPGRAKTGASKDDDEEDELSSAEAEALDMATEAARTARAAAARAIAAADEHWHAAGRMQVPSHTLHHALPAYHPCFHQVCCRMGDHDIASRHRAISHIHACLSDAVLLYVGC